MKIFTAILKVQLMGNSRDEAGAKLKQALDEINKHHPFGCGGMYLYSLNESDPPPQYAYGAMIPPLKDKDE